MATTPLLLRAAAAADHERPRNLEDGAVTNGVSGSPPQAGKQRGRKAGKNPAPKKPPQRGMGVAQLERLRIEERWKKFASGEDQASNSHQVLLPDRRFPPLHPVPSFSDLLAVAPVTYSRQQPQIAAAYGHAVGGAGLPSFANQMPSWWNNHQSSRFGDGSGFVPVTGCGAGALVAAAQTPEPPYKTHSFPHKKKRMENYGIPEPPPVTGYSHYPGPSYNTPNEFVTPSPEVLAVHRKISENRARRSNVVTEYEFFPEKINEEDDDHQVMTKLLFTDHMAPPPVAAGGEASNAIDLSLRL